jgi:transcriptional regulator with GAF, ATPase, and Fis domain
MENMRNEAGEARFVLDVKTPARPGDRKEVIEILLDLLTDYMCSNVTESLRAVQGAIEKRIILRTLRETGGNQKEAAKLLGVTPPALNYKIKRHRIKIAKNLYAGMD